jgi:hypothetical protein
LATSYLGFTLTPEGIKPGKNKLKAIQHAKAPKDVKMIRSFMGLCNFFRTHIKDFAVIAAPLFKHTREKTLATKEALCLNQPWMHSLIFGSNWCPNL